MYRECIREETLQLIEQAIETLPPQCKRVFLKLFVEGKSLLETAQEMNVSLYTVKNQRTRGIKLLRNRLPPTAFYILLLALFASAPTTIIAKGPTFSGEANITLFSKQELIERSSSNIFIDVQAISHHIEFLTATILRWQHLLADKHPGRK